jgi:stearoyl-CoA desaturase (delta-9 desaturase)
VAPVRSATLERAEAPTSFLKRVLRTPGYGWSRGDELYVPTTLEILREWAHRLNLLHSRKAWLSVMVWSFSLLLLPFGAVFLLNYFSWKLMLAGFLYSMVWLGTHGTVYLHRYGTHRAFTFTNRYYRFVCQNLAIKIVPEEVYIVSHHVHHAYSDQPGDPYNAKAGFLYCFLAGDLHQQINPELSTQDYTRLAGFLKHTGVRANRYEQYRHWGSITHPARLLSNYLLNWAFWYGAFYALGGHALATALFGWAAVWAFGIRAHNYDLHAGGKDRRLDGLDFDRESLAVNRLWPGLVAGEWHNNHHLFPTSVQAGFLPWQVDSAFAFIRFYRLLGGVSSWRNLRSKFYERHYRPHLEAREEPVGAGGDGSHCASGEEV